MTVSYDEMTAVHNGQRFVFVLYTPESDRHCGGRTCAFYDNGCRLDACTRCVVWNRKDARDGYWKETHDHIT